MKLLHLGDLHIGKSLGDFDLYSDQEYILNQVIDIIQEKSVDAVLIAGDVYDRSIPSEAAVTLLDYFIGRLAELHIKTFIISGNHDSDDRLNFGSRLFESNQIYITSKFEGILKKQTLQDDFGELNIYLLPFVKASQVKHYFPKEEIATYEEAVKVILNHSDFDKNKRNILVAHQFVAGRQDPEIAGSEGAGVKTVGLVEKIGYDCFKAFDYVALGHIHSPQRVGKDEIRYAGSPLKYSLSEVNNDKSVPIVTLGKKGEVEIELVPLKPLRNVRHLKGTIRKLLDKENITESEDFIYVTLTDEEMINDAIGIFQQYYPNTVKIDYENSHTKELENIDIVSVTESKTFTEQISDFYRLMYDCDISNEEMEIMNEVAREAGVIDEAN